MRGIYTPETTRKLAIVETAKTYLLDYRPPGATVTKAETLRLCELVGAGWQAADAASQVQAETMPA